MKMDRLDEVNAKLERLRTLMEAEELDAVVLGGATNFSWITAGGDDVVALASERGAAVVVVTLDGQFVVSDNIEAGRLAEEELQGLEFELVQDEWHKNNLVELLDGVVTGEVAADGDWLVGASDYGDEISRLRWSLLAPEVDRYRALGSDVSRCLTETAREISIGQTEHEIAGLLTGKLKSLGIAPNVILIAADERIAKFRHPLPTANKLDRYAMLVASVRRHGLQASATRIVHFGDLSVELREKHDAVMKVDACFCLETRPGAKVNSIFSHAVQTYAATGFANEWRLHHQGGACGYAGRDYKATSDTAEMVRDNQAFAWNPSITGTKSEDTILATEAGPEILTPAADWPTVEIEYHGQTIERPDILIR
ncbi:MAG: aminopeptidase P family N-terminal domain-containing protein [Armatimonadia bacterium]